MIQKVLKDASESRYGKYFLAFEAPGDDDEPAPMRTVRARPNNRARFDFTNDIIQDDDIDTVGTDTPAPADDMTDDDLGDIALPGMDDTGAGDVGDDDLADIDLPDPDAGAGQTPEDPMADIDLPGMDDTTNVGGDTAAPTNVRARRGGNRYDFTTGFDDPIDDDDVGDDLNDIDLPGMDNTAGGADPADDNGMGDDLADIDLPGMDDTGAGDAGTDDLADIDLPGMDDTGADAGGDDLADIDLPGMDDATTDDATADPTATTDTTDPATGGDTSTPPDLGGDDFTTDDPNAAADPNDQNAAADPNAQQQAGNAPGLEYDSVRKYTLFKEFMRLRTAVSKYIERLEASISDDPESNQIIKLATTKFREIYDLLTDYMMMKYELCSYVQNLLFYQRIVASIQLVFKLLKTSKDIQNKDDKDGNRSSHTRRRSDTKTDSRSNKNEKSKEVKKASNKK